MNLIEILGMFKRGKTSAKSHIKNLIEIALADGQFIEVENELLKSIAKRNGFSEKQVNEIRKNPDSIKLDIPSNGKERFHQFYDLVHMMSVDKEIHPEEMKLCNLFAIKFGYHRDNVQDLIDSTISCIEYHRDPDDTMSRVIRLLS